MVRRTIAALALLLAGGCLAPQDIEEAEDSTHAGNHAPRIVPDQALVAGMAATRLAVQSSCPPVEFLVGAVEDLDREDDLFVRFFVDYDQGCEGCRDVRKEVPVRATPETQELRTIRDGFKLQLPLDEGTHVVEAWVSDGFSTDPNARPENRAVLEGRDADVAVWVIVVQNGENQECLPVAY